MSGGCKRIRLTNMANEYDEEMAAAEDTVIILDAGAQYGQVIDRRVRELSVHSIVAPLDTTAAEIRQKGYKAIIISGGPNSVTADNAPSYDPLIFQSGLPILGICYGFQMINNEFGGKVESLTRREDGVFTIAIDTKVDLFKGLEEKQEVLLTHGDTVTQVASGFNVICKSENTVAGIANVAKKIYGLQFHPEIDLSVNGQHMLRNFLGGIAGFKFTFKMASREESCIRYIQEVVGDKQVLLLVSGGVDSTVCGALINKALKDKTQLIALHIDNGFMRKDESAKVVESLKTLGIRLISQDASRQFYNATTVLPPNTADHKTRPVISRSLNKTIHPEEKRMIIGDTFMKVANEIIEMLELNPEDVFLAQGTLRPDLIESASELASGKAQVIKTHHNDTELVRQLRKKGRVVEPLKTFHKDEVRCIGRDLGLPDVLVQRHPFPGPGLAIRVLCVAEIYKEQDFNETSILLKLLTSFTNSTKQQHNLISRINEGLTESERVAVARICVDMPTLTSTLLPIRTVGVQGDGRSYSYVAALSCDDPQVNWAHIFTLAKIIPKLCHNVNRIVYVFGAALTKPINDITPTTLTTGVLEVLRECDDIANVILQESGEYSKISQMPVVMIPVHFEHCSQLSAGDEGYSASSCQRSIVLRPFITNDFMTGLAAVPGKHIQIKTINKMVTKLCEVESISRVLLDVTSKPPGTTEWE